MSTSTDTNANANPEVISNIDKNTLDTILDTEYVVYSYLTTDYKPGTIIVDPRLRPVFDEQKLFDMEVVSSESIKLRHILEKDCARHDRQDGVGEGFWGLLRC